MDAALIARLYNDDHARCLSWFEDHAGEAMPLPKPLGKELNLVTQFKGIYKPKWMPYVLSIRMTAQDRYVDSQVTRREDGTWSFTYAQEEDRRYGPEKLYTNRAIRACIEDRIPVGVLRKELNNTPYTVLGLAVPTGEEAGFFHFEGYKPGSKLGIDIYEAPFSGVAEKVAWPAQEGSLPSDEYDARMRVLAEISRRMGQPLFRAKLLEAYDWHCAVTGCSVHSVLEAAHIRPYRGPQSNIVSNGILLRADIHILLDKQLIGLNPETQNVVISDFLTGTSYDSLSDHPISVPSQIDSRPSSEALERAWLDFQKAEAIRLRMRSMRTAI